jgi:hypothetical protein
MNCQTGEKSLLHLLALSRPIFNEWEYPQQQSILLTNLIRAGGLRQSTDGDFRWGSWD